MSALSVRVKPDGVFEVLRHFAARTPEDAAHHYDIDLDPETGVIERVVRTRGLDIPTDRRGKALEPRRAANRVVTLAEPNRPLTGEALREVARALVTPYPLVWTGDDPAASVLGADAMLEALEAARYDGRRFTDEHWRVLAYGGAHQRITVTPLLWLRHVPGAGPAYSLIEGHRVARNEGGKPAVLLRLSRKWQDGVAEDEVF
ncbi:hypothetical protein [Microbacterium binotii]|uniref:Uncharacterized protein n=1 Tax=Microbacterium binotii TaxID=462710 RepID=A0ABP6BHJ3_9MICO